MLAAFLLPLSCVVGGTIRMPKKMKALALLLALSALSFPAAEAAKRRSQWRIEQGEITGEGPAVLWRDPTDISSRDLFYGPGGEKHAPHGTFTFLKEDLKGTNPKIVVRDEEGVEWGVKPGAEAR